MSSNFLMRNFLRVPTRLKRVWSYNAKRSLSSTSKNLCELCCISQFHRPSIRPASTVAQFKSPEENVVRHRKAANARSSYLWTMSTQLAKPFTVYVVQCEEEENEPRRFRLMFRFTMPMAGKPEQSIDQMINFQRNYSGLLKDTFARMKLRLIDLHEQAQGIKRRKKKAKMAPEASIPEMAQENNEWDLRILTADGSELQETVSNEEAFLTGGRTLTINGEPYRIVGPASSLAKLDVDVVPIVGCPVMASINVSGDGSPQTCQYFWFVSDGADEAIAEPQSIACDHDEISGAVRISRMDGWTLRSTDRVYVPQEGDVGRLICLIVAPQGSNGVFSVPRVWTAPVEKTDRPDGFRKGVVIAPPDSMIWNERHRLCEEEVPFDAFRCVSYNILADLYMNLTLPQEELYFPYCPRQYQAHSYRYPLLLKELAGYRADIYCLQEVDTRNYVRFLEPYLVGRGWRGICKRKGGVVNEGSAVFYRPEKLELVASDDVILAELLSEGSESFDDLSRVAKQSDLVWNIFLTRPAALQVAAFRCLNASNCFICVGTTHLHFKPHHTHIRLLQAAVSYRHLLNVALRISQQFPDAKVGIMFCGDFNSTPSTGVCQMLQAGRLDATHEDWQPKVEDSDESVEDGETSETLALRGIDLAFPKRLRSACPSEYTTLTHKFCGELDHIFISDELSITRVIDTPPHGLVTKYTGIPSPICPSDHLPLICELKFT